MNTEQKQAWAYNRKDKIKVGDRFLWKKCREQGYITSGTLPVNYMAASEAYEEAGVLTVVKEYIGENGYGLFVDYWLAYGYDPAINYERCDCIVINGPDAFRMERVE